MKYELMLILNPKQTDKEIEKNLKEIKGFLTENAFDLVDEDIWGLRDLAYKIHGNNKGYYVVLNFSGDTAGLLEVQKDLRLQAGVLRSMLSKIPDDYILLRYETLATTGKASKISSPAEELSKKVRGQTRGFGRGPSEHKEHAEHAKAQPERNYKEETTPENKEKLDESLKAIIEDKDLAL